MIKTLTVDTDTDTDTDADSSESESEFRVQSSELIKKLWRNSQFFYYICA